MRSSSTLTPIPLPPTTSADPSTLRTSSCIFSASLNSSADPAAAAARPLKVEAEKSRYLRAWSGG